VSVNWQCLL